MASKILNVFYSWQSELPSKANSQLIRSALNDAANKINEDDGLGTLTKMDEATRNIPGSPNIADSIFHKIKNSDVFVCDLSKVAHQDSLSGEPRSYCNPNVAIELGYAIGELGWNRIILVFNEAFGKLPDDLPFDAKGHRASTYNCPDSDNKAIVNNAKGNLRDTLFTALTEIIRTEPKRLLENETKSHQEVQRSRDIEQLKQLFYFINLHVIDQFLARLDCHGRITMVGQSFCEALCDLVKKSSFHIYDADLRIKIEQFVNAWEDCLTYGHELDISKNGREAYFHMPGDVFVNKEQEQHFNYMRTRAAPCRAALDDLLKYIRNFYMEIDVNETGKEALIEYNKSH